MLRISVLLLSLAPALLSGLDVDALMRRVVTRELAAVRQPRDYTYRYREVERKLGSDGATRRTEVKAYEVSILHGRQFNRLYSRDDKPLSPEEDRKEQERFERQVSRRASMTPEQRAREDERERQEERLRREFIAQIPDLYDFALVGEETIEGRNCWLIAAHPRQSAHPRGMAAKSLSQLNGQLWIDKAEERWARVEAEALRPIRFGWFLGNVGQGSKISFAQMRVSDEVWLPKQVVGRLRARFLVLPFHMESETVYFDYRRFQADSQVIYRPE